MTTLKEAAQAYVPPQTKNIVELDKVSTDIEVKEQEGKNSKGEPFTYNYIEVNGEKYRVPNSVLDGIKALLTKLPNLKFVSVIKSGEGMNTKYQVIPMDQVQ